ncbi:hypothetical protein D3C80_1085640 [compost metagenome]
MAMPTRMARICPGTNARLAANGAMPKTICSDWVAKNTKPTNSARLNRLTRMAPVNVPLPSNARSSRGTARRNWRRTNKKPAPMPISSAKATTPSPPVAARCLIA